MNPTKVSYYFITLTLITVCIGKLGTPFITVLFSLLILRLLDIKKYRWLTVTLFTFIVCLISWGLVYVAKSAVIIFPRIVSDLVPVLNSLSEKYNVPLPFDDLEGFKTTLIDITIGELEWLSHAATVATKEIVYLIIGFVVAIGVFLSSGKLDLGEHKIKRNLYSVTCNEIEKRFIIFFNSFKTVMGAQIVISSINTALTSVYLFAVGIPHFPLVVACTFLCGLLPVVGNLISNTIIVGISLTISIKAAVESLIFLVVIHKLEYFLNSKIIGHRIKNPMWLTLLGLLVGEKLMGIPGMILAPVLLNYLKLEGGQIEYKKEKN